MHCLLGLIGEIVDMGDDVTGAVVCELISSPGFAPLLLHIVPGIASKQN
jgi:hypothetical protein